MSIYVSGESTISFDPIRSQMLSFLERSDRSDIILTIKQYELYNEKISLSSFFMTTEQLHYSLYPFDNLRLFCALLLMNVCHPCLIVHFIIFVRELNELLLAYGPQPSYDDMAWYGLAYTRIYEVF